MLYVDIHKKLNDFELDINFSSENECIGIMGSSGCGKTMTLKCIAGIEKPDRGKIILNNKMLFDSEKKTNVDIQKRNVGFLFQSYALFNNMSVKDNISIGLKSKNYDKSYIEEKVQEVFEIFRISGLEKRFPKTLSGGQKQRVALARMMITKPDFVLLDEPFSALDSDLKSELILEMKAIIEKSCVPVILVSHDRNEIESLCTKLYKMENGVFIK